MNTHDKICKKCGQPCYIIKPVLPPHYAKYECKNGHWQGWVKKPKANDKIFKHLQ